MDDYKRGISLQWSTALRDLMKEKGISVEQVGDLLGRSHGYVSHRTTGREALSLDIIQATAILLGLTPKALMVELTERVTRQSEASSAPPE